MGVEFNEKLEKGIAKIKSMVEEASLSDGVMYKLEMVRLTQYRDVLVKAYGNKEYKKDFNRYNQEKGFINYENEDGYTKDRVYSIVKELEFRNENINKTGGIREGYNVLLELYAEIFNHWGSYSKLLEKEDEVEEVKGEPKTRAERRELGL